MADLLDVISMKPAKGQKVVHLMVDFVVDPDSGPFLVSSSEDFLWLDEESLDEDNRIRAAVRKVKRKGPLYLDILGAVEHISREAEWGNIQPLTRDGIGKAVQHLKDYGLDEVDILVSKKMLDIYRGHGASVRPCEWLPDGIAVAVPKDRGFLGILGYLGRDQVVVLVHNSSRGIAICQASEGTQKEKEKGEDGDGVA